MFEEFNDAKQAFDSHLASMARPEPAITVSVNINEMNQMIKKMQQLVKVYYADNVNQNQEQVEDTKLNTSIEVSDPKRKDSPNQDFLQKIAKHLLMEKGRNAWWYDANYENEDRNYHNWEPVLKMRKGLVLDSKGRTRKIDDESLLVQEPQIDTIGDCHVAVTKLKNGYIKWLTSVARQQREDKLRQANERKNMRRSKSPKKKGLQSNKNAEEFVIEYAERSGVELPQFRFTNNDSKSGGLVDAELSFAGRTFTSSAKKKKAARAMCYHLAMKHVL